MSETGAARLQNRIPGLLVLAVAVLSAWNLWAIWSSDVYARGGAIFMLLWLVPLVYVVIKESRSTRESSDFFLLVLSLLGCLIGWVGSLNVAKHVGLALAFGGLARPHLFKYAWLLGAFAWLPATGWLAHATPVNGWPLRTVLLVLSLGISWPWWRRGRA